MVFRFSIEGGELFYKLTSNNIDEQMAIVLNDKVIAQATITEPIRSNVAVTGFNDEEVKDLLIVLKTGALPISLKIESINN